MEASDQFNLGLFYRIIFLREIQGFQAREEKLVQKENR